MTPGVGQMREYHRFKAEDGSLDVTRATDDEMVPLGEFFAERVVERRIEQDGLTYVAVFEVRGGVPYCTKISIEADPSTVVRQKHLDALKLNQMRDDTYALVGLCERTLRDDGHYTYTRNHGGPAFRRHRKNVERATKRRRVTPEFLRKVAEVHASARPEGRGRNGRLRRRGAPGEALHQGGAREGLING